MLETLLATKLFYPSVRPNLVARPRLTQQLAQATSWPFTLVCGLDNAGLAAEMRSQLGTDIALGFSQPQPAGGVVTTPGDYGRMLRKMLSGSLRIGSMLGAHATCTNPSTCPTAVSTPIPEESWDYSLGHWVESDPMKGDGSFSSAGAFGFYPWIDKSKTWYGIVAREAKADGSGVGEGEKSMRCGKLIRSAWITGAPR